MSDADGRLTPERAVRLLRAKAGQLEQYVRDVMPGDLALTAPLQIAALTADVALVAILLADHLERCTVAAMSDTPTEPTPVTEPVTEPDPDAEPDTATPTE